MEEAIEKILKKLEKLETIEGKLDKLQRQLDDITKENEEIKAENQTLKQVIETQERKIQNIEKQMRKNKLVIHGIDELENESENQLKKEIEKILKDMKMENHVIQGIREVGRIGRKVNKINRPVRIEIDNWNNKIDILKATRLLKGTKIVIEEDYTKETLLERKQLLPYMIEARQKGQRAFLNHNKLKINGRNYTIQEIIENGKVDKKKKGRTISERSPEGTEEKRYKQRNRNIEHDIDETKN